MLRNPLKKNLKRRARASYTGALLLQIEIEIISQV